MYNLEPMPSYDRQLMYDFKSNTHIVMGLAILERFDADQMGDYLMTKIKVIKKCQTKLVKKFGDYWYQRLSDQEFNDFRRKVIQQPTAPIHDIDSLFSYML